MPDVKSDGEYTIPQQAGVIVWDIPFPDNKVYLFTQEWECDGTVFGPIEIGTQHPDYVDFQLMAETTPQHLGGNVLRWTRTYAKVPEPRDEFESHAYTFPAIPLGFSSAANFSKSRAVMTKNVNSRLTFEYFQTNDPVGEIEQLDRWQVWGSGGPGFPANDSTIGYSVGNASDPTKDQYIDEYIGTEVIAEDSYFRRWVGNIYERVTRYVILE